MRRQLECHEKFILMSFFENQGASGPAAERYAEEAADALSTMLDNHEVISVEDGDIRESLPSQQLLNIVCKCNATGVSSTVEIDDPSDTTTFHECMGFVYDSSGKTDAAW